MDSAESKSNLETSSGLSLPSLNNYNTSTENDNLSKNTAVLNNNDENNSSSTSIYVKSVVSDDEGYVSGKEEFEPPGLVGEGNLDAPLVDTSEKVELGKGDLGEDTEGGFPAVDDKGVEDFDGESEILDSAEKLDVSTDVGEVKSGGEIVDSNVGNLVVEEVENKGEEPEVVEPETREEVAEPVKLTPQGDSVVETIQVDVKGSGVAVVGETKENGDAEDVSVVKDASEAAAVEPEKREVVGPADVGLTAEGDAIVNSMAPGEVAVVGETEKNGDAESKPEAEDVVGVAIVEPEKLEVVGPGDLGLTAERDSIVDSIQVDSLAPGAAVVGETDQNGDTESKPKAEDVDEVAIVEPEKPGVVNPGDVRLTTEGDSIVDAIQVDPVAPGVAVVGETDQNGDTESKPEAEDVDEVAIVEPENSEVVGPGDVRLTTEGDSIVDAIQVDPVAPGVAVVGEMEENEGEKIEGVEVPLKSVGGVDEGDVGGAEEVVSTREVAEDYHSSETSVESKELKSLQAENHVVGNENLDAGAAADMVNGIHTPITSNDSVKKGGNSDEKVGLLEETVASDGDVNQLHNSIDGTIHSNGEHSIVHEYNEVEDELDEDVDAADSFSDGDTDGMIFGSSEAARKFMEKLERGSGVDSHTGGGSSLDQSQGIDGQIVTDSEEEGDTDDEGGGKELFDSAALAALLKAATGADSDGGGVTITGQDGSRLFTVERPAGLGSSLRSLRPAPRPNRPTLFNPLAVSGGGESEENLNEDEKKKLEKLQEIRVKFLRLVHRLGLSPDESVAGQVLYRLALLGGRQGSQTFSLDAAKETALKLESEDKDDLDFSINILVLGKSGVGKSATINSLFGEEKASIDAFETGTGSAKQISGLINGVKVHVVDTPGLKSSLMEQAFNRSVLSSVQKVTKKRAPDVVLYVDRLDSQTRDLNDLPLLKTVTSALGAPIWRSAIVTLTHAASAPPDGPSGAPLSYEVFVNQRSHVVQQSIGHAVGDLRMMSPNLMNPVSLVENHRDCRKNREGQKILPNGQSWRPQLLLLCYSMKILSEASSLSKPQDPFDHRKLFGFRTRAPPLPYMLSSMLQSRTHPKLPSDQGGDSVDSDIDLDDLSDSDQEEADEYDQLPPFKPLKKAQIAKLSKDQRKAYFEEYDYRVKLLQKKQWSEELRRMREIKKKGKDAITDYGFAEDDADSGAAAPVAVPLPDMALPPSFDGDNPAYRYRFLEPTSQFLARPVLDSHGWDHDCGYDGVNLEHSLAIINRFPVAYTFQITKDKKDFSVSLDSSVSAKHGENMSSMAGFDIQSMGKQLAYIVRGETKLKKSKNKAAAGISLTFLGENTVPGVKIEDQITLGKQYVLVGSAGAVRSQHDTAYGANIELQRRELDYPIGQVQSTLSMSLVKWRGDLALGFNSLAQFSIGRNSKVAVRAGINNKLSGQVTVRTSSSEHLSLALAAILPTAISIYKKLWPGADQKYSIY